MAGNVVRPFADHFARPGNPDAGSGPGGGYGRDPNPEIGLMAELHVCASAILTPGFWESFAVLPDPDDFDEPSYAALWAAVVEVRKRDGKITRVGLVRTMRELGWQEAHALAALETARPMYLPLLEARDLVDFLLQRRLGRAARTVCEEAMRELATTRDAPGVVQRVEAQLGDLARRIDQADAWVAVEHVEAQPNSRTETGFEELDRLTGGLPVGTLTVLGGRPGMGKSALAVAIAKNIALRGEAVGVFSLEMPGADLLDRMAADLAWRQMPLFCKRTENPRYADARRWMEPRKREAFDAALERARALPVYIDERQGLTIEQVRLGARRLRTRCDRVRANGTASPLRLLVVDHLGHVRPSDARKSRHDQLSEITSELMKLAKELELPVLLLCQLNREVERRDDKRPQVADLRESGSIEENAHTILLAYRQAHYDDEARDRGEEIDEDEADRVRHVMEIHVAKNRGGARGKVSLFCEIACNALRNRGEGASLSSDPADMFEREGA